MTSLNDIEETTHSRIPSVARTVWRPWAESWLGVLGLAMVNGGVHRAYEPALGVLPAEQLSNATLVAVVLPWALLVERRHPTCSRRQAYEVGAIWGAFTMAFEFLGGHYVNGANWGTLVRAYDLSAGHLWSLAVVGIVLAPDIARLLHRRALDR